MLERRGQGEAFCTHPAESHSTRGRLSRGPEDTTWACFVNGGMGGHTWE